MLLIICNLRMKWKKWSMGCRIFTFKKCLCTWMILSSNYDRCPCLFSHDSFQKAASGQWSLVWPIVLLDPLCNAACEMLLLLLPAWQSLESSSASCRLETARSRMNEMLIECIIMECQKQNNHVFMVKLYFHCYANINIASVQFQLLNGMIFIMFVYIYLD